MGEREEDWWRVVSEPAPLRAQVVAKLRAAITEGLFKPGTRLVERGLADRLQVSRPLLREAVRQLEAEGLIEVDPRRGAMVRALDLNDVGELHDIGAALEALCARYFAERATPEEFALLERRLAEMEAAFAGGHRPTIVSAKFAFNEALIAGSHSGILEAYLRQLNARVSYLWSSSLDRPGRVPESLRELRDMLAAIRRKDGEAAAEAARIYVQHGKATAIRALADNSAAQEQNAQAASKPITRARKTA